MKNFQFSKKIIIGVIIAIVALLLLFGSVVIVNPGHTGVVVTLGQTSNTTLQEGFHLKLPIIQWVAIIDNRIQKLEVDTEAFSKDLQTVQTKIAINYRVNTNMSYSIYKNVGPDYENVLIIPAVEEVLKAISAQYTAEQSVTNRELISDGLAEGLNNKLNDLGLSVTDINIVNYDFSEAFITAIEEKQVSQQKLLKAETEKQTTITNAEAEAESVKIKATAEAEANKILNASLSANVIEYQKIQKWDGVLPQVVGESSTLIDLTDKEKEN